LNIGGDKVAAKTQTKTRLAVDLVKIASAELPCHGPQLCNFNAAPDSGFAPFQTDVRRGGWVM
jgi:hypothetical protein